MIGKLKIDRLEVDELVIAGERQSGLPGAPLRP